MAVARSFRDGWLTSLKIDALRDDSAELFLFRLGLKADKNGVYHGEPDLLRAAVYPLQVSRRRLADVTRYRDKCARAGLLRLWTAADGRPYVQILKFRQKVPLEKPLHPLPPGEPDDAGQQSLAIDDPPPRSKEKKKEVSEARLGRDPHTLDEEAWLQKLQDARPEIDVRAELLRCQKKYPHAGRGFFVDEWLKRAEPRFDGTGTKPKAAKIEPEPEAWRLHLKDHYQGESWAESAAAFTWADLPPQWRAKIYREMKP